MEKMELTQEELIKEIKAEIERLKQMVKTLEIKKGNEDYNKLRNKLSVLYAKLKYHTDPNFRLKKLDEYNKWYETNKKKNKPKKYIHIPICIC